MQDVKFRLGSSAWVQLSMLTMLSPGGAENFPVLLADRINLSIPDLDINQTRPSWTTCYFPSDHYSPRMSVNFGRSFRFWNASILTAKAQNIGTSLA
eukprot:SAG31_NODE_23235_length_508_cov_1.376528_1_plen_96_part_10